jgi:hypothetical protein
VVGEDGEVEEEDTDNDSPGNEEILVNTKEDEAEPGQNILYDEEVDVPVANEEIHEGIDFAGSFFNMEDGEVGVENAKQDNEEEE